MHRLTARVLRERAAGDGDARLSWSSDALTLLEAQLFDESQRGPGETSARTWSLRSRRCGRASAEEPDTDIAVRGTSTCGLGGTATAGRRRPDPGRRNRTTHPGGLRAGPGCRSPGYTLTSRNNLAGRL